jgi:hypothetical protein
MFHYEWSVRMAAHAQGHLTPGNVGSHLRKWHRRDRTGWLGSGPHRAREEDAHEVRSPAYRAVPVGSAKGCPLMSFRVW